MRTITASEAARRYCNQARADLRRLAENEIDPTCPDYQAAVVEDRAQSLVSASEALADAMAAHWGVDRRDVMDCLESAFDAIGDCKTDAEIDGTGYFGVYANDMAKVWAAMAAHQSDRAARRATQAQRRPS